MITKCSRCRGELEKPRFRTLKPVCQKCQKERAKFRVLLRKMGINTL